MKLPTLLVDAGNTCLKYAYLDKGVLSKQQYYFYAREKTPIHLFRKVLSNDLKNCSKVLMVSVLGETFDQEASFVAQSYSVLFANIKSQRLLSGVTNSYLEPEKLGADRFVALIAAHHLTNMNKQKKDNKACIIIDSGTATTIDAINKDGHHLGGLILPGINLCKNSLLESTNQLSQWNEKDLDIVPTLFATETTTAINSASIYGLSGAIDRICNKMEREMNKLSQQTPIDKIICGGNTKWLKPYLESNYLHKESLIMIGLKVILANEDVRWD